MTSAARYIFSSPNFSFDLDGLRSGDPLDLKHKLNNTTCDWVIKAVG